MATNPTRWKPTTGRWQAMPSADLTSCARRRRSRHSYLSPRYRLPLDEVPDALRSIAVDLAICRLARIDTMTDEYRQRYEDAIGHLKRIGKGEAGLGIDTQDDDEPDDGAGLIGSPVKMVV